MVDHETVGTNRVRRTGGGVDIGSVLGKWGEVRFFVSEQTLKWTSSSANLNPLVSLQKRAFCSSPLVKEGCRQQGVNVNKQAITV